MIRFITLLLLVMFSFSALVSAEEEYWEYTFRSGDSIWSIAEKYTTSVNNWDEIQKINKIRQGSDRRIQPGTRIVIPISMLKQQPSPALVVAVSGVVKVLRADGSEVDAIVGTKLYSGDQVVTGEKQNLRMQFADKSELQVLANSEVVLDKLSRHKKSGMADTKIRLNNGSVNTWVEKQNSDSHYEITTPSAVTAVRGTSFRLSTDASQVSRTEVTGGVVAVAAGDVERSVKDGYGIVAEKDKPLPEPVKLLPAPELSVYISENRKEYLVSWLEMQGAKSFHYRIAKDRDFNQVVLDDFTEQHVLDIKNLPVGLYYISVRGVDQYRLEGVDSVITVEKQEIIQEDDSYWKIIMSIGLAVMFLL